MKKISYFLVALGSFFALNASAADVIITNQTEAEAYIAAHQDERGTVDNFTISGDITQAQLDALYGCVATVNGKMTLGPLTLGAPTDGSPDNSVTNIENFFRNIEENGSIELLPMVREPQLGGDDQFFPEVINGDFIIRNMLSMPGNQGYGNCGIATIKEVKGDYIMQSTDYGRSNSDWAFRDLQRVGGDFIYYVAGADCWSAKAPNFTYVGGDFQLIGPDGGAFERVDPVTGAVTMETPKYFDVNILEKMEYIGGNVKIVNLPNIGVQGGIGGGASGWCFVRYLIDNEIINYACNDVVLGFEDEPVDLSVIGACLWASADMDNPPMELPAKDPNCASTGINEVVLENTFASVYPTVVTDLLTIDAQVALSNVEIYNIEGRTVMSLNNLPAQQHVLQVGHLTKGFYMVKLVSADGKVQVIEFIK